MQRFFNTRFFGSLSSFVLSLALLSPASAFTIADYKRITSTSKSEQQIMEMYVIGTGQGIFWSSAYNKANGNSRIFCTPPKMPFTGDVILSVFNKAVKENRFKPTDDLELALIYELIRVFPC
jgi:hypothetical protein